MSATPRQDNSAFDRLRTLRKIRALSRTASARAERQLILLSAGTAARRSQMAARAEELASGVEWTHITETLRQRRLLPTLGPRILELGATPPNAAFAEAVSEALETGRRQGTFLQLVCLQVMTALADAGIPSVALKGPLLAAAIYDDVGRRLSTDVDLLVAAEHMPEAVHVVRGLGYRDPADYIEASGLPMVHFALTHESGGLPPVELHWRTHWYEPDFGRSQLLPPRGTRPESWRPAPVDEFVSLLLFYARDGFVDLRLATDLGAWWDVFGSEVDPGAIDQLLRKYPALARAIIVAAKVAETTVGLPARQIIGDVRELNLRDRMAKRLANPNPTTRRSQLYADMGLIDGLLTPPGAFRAFARRQILLPREVFQERAQNTPGWRSKSPLGYGTRVIARYGIAMTRLLRAGETLR